MSSSQRGLATTEFEAMVSLPELIPPLGAKPVGVFDDGSPAGKIIYEQRVLDLDATVAKRRPRMGPDGQPVMRRSAAGVPIQQVYELPEAVFRVRRGILQGFRNKKVKFIERFEETPEDIREREERQQVEAFSVDLAQEAVRRGFKNASQMLSALFGERSPTPTEAAGSLAELAEEADDLIAQGGVGLEEVAEQEAPAVAVKAPKGRKSQS